MAATNGTANPSQPETKIVDEIPEALNEILLLIVKNFFSNEHYLVVYYILRAECIREENLRSRLNFEQKHLRQLLASLKAEKLVKERLLSQKNEHNRNVSIIFYFINYRAVLNVLRYKIDHMRQKLEAREKDDMNQSHYKCEQCSSTYHTLDIKRILDPMTGMLRCWRCQGEVTTDESVAPSQATRTSIARFNEQMNPLFVRIEALAGIQLAPHLLEPDINKFLEEEDKARELQTQLMDFTTHGGGRAGLGGIAHSYATAAGISYQHGDTITVDFNADSNNKPAEETKEVPLWLQDDAIGGDGGAQADEEQRESKEKEKSGVSLHLLEEIEGVEDENKEEPEAKKQKTDEEEYEDEEEEEEEEMIDVAGKKVPWSEITPEMVANEMSEEERQRYTEIMQERMADY